jgi:serine/threonine protein kinase
MTEISVLGNNYYKTNVLGEGSFGSVVTVYNDDGDTFAMKIFKKESDDYDDSDLDSTGSSNENKEDVPTLDVGTLREISIISMCSLFSSSTPIEKPPLHTNLITMSDITFNQEGEICMLMPKMSLDLYDAIKKDILSVRCKVNIAYRLLSVLDFLHKNDIIHRDIKTENILLNDDMRPFIADFSLAKVFGNNEVETGHTHTGEMGTQVYKAPEVIKKKRYNKSCDVYSLGVVFLELFNGLLKVDNDIKAQDFINGILSKLSDKALPLMIKSMLNPDKEKRITCEDAMKLPIFSRFEKRPTEKVLNKQVNSIKYKRTNLSKKDKKKCKIFKDDIHRKWSLLGYRNPITKDAARIYYDMLSDSKQGEENFYIHCLILAAKLYETELLSFSTVKENIKSFDPYQYVKDEVEIFNCFDYCLFI